MSDIVNLNKARKKKRAAEKDKASAGNRVKFGRTKGEKLRDKLVRERAARVAEGKKRERD